MNRGTENDAVFLQRTDIPAYQEIWLGQYKGLSGWVEKIGKNFILLIVRINTWKPFSLFPIGSFTNYSLSEVCSTFIL
jgi:hypothetical protein